MFIILCPRQPVLLLLFSGCFCCYFLMDHQALRDWLYNMSTSPLDVKVLSHAQQLQHLLKEAFTCWRRHRLSKVHKKSISAFFRHQPKPVLDKCEGEIRHVGAIVFADLYLFTFWRFQMSDRVCQSLACHTLASCILPAWRMRGEQKFMRTPQGCMIKS